jgi:hypothetical protein
MALAVTLLGAITIRGAERRAMTTHHISKHLGRPTEGRLVKHNPIRAEHPVLGVDALDPHAHLITGHGRTPCAGSFAHVLIGAGCAEPGCVGVRTSTNAI